MTGSSFASMLRPSLDLQFDEVALVCILAKSRCAAQCLVVTGVCDGLPARAQICFESINNEWNGEYLT